MRLIQFIIFMKAALHVSGGVVPTQQREWMVVDPVNQYQKL